MLQKQADELAEHLQRNNIEAMSYHAGKPDVEVSVILTLLTLVWRQKEEKNSEIFHVGPS